MSTSKHGAHVSGEAIPGEEVGLVTEVWMQEGYGVVTTRAGVELRFERADCQDFARLVVGSRASFRPGEGPDGEVATHLRWLPPMPGELA